MATSKTRRVIREILNPIRHNNLESRRRKLKLSRVAVARILDVDPATVFRQERGVMSSLWDYAMRGIEAEASNKATKAVLRDHQAKIDRGDFFPKQIGERGYRYTAEKMKTAKPRPPRKAPPSRNQLGLPRSRVPSRSAVTAAADRAEARSKSSS